MFPTRPSLENNFDWQPQPTAWLCIVSIVEACVEREPLIRDLAAQMLSQTGTRIIDWITEIHLPHDPQQFDQLTTAGFEVLPSDGALMLDNPYGMFPTVVFDTERNKPRLTIKVDRFEKFAEAMKHRFDREPVALSHPPERPEELVFQGDHCDLAARESLAQQGPPGESAAEQIQAYRKRLASRPRPVAISDTAAAFDATIKMFRKSVDTLGQNLACELFFQSERDYWQNRNRAAQVQKQRQDLLGLGWANHDHHTYRSSRLCFHRLVEVLEVLGFECRERFYAGAQAGWGAQVLEQSSTGIIVFADVDLSPEEVAGDFAHQPLPHHSNLGTVGLWCRLHGEAFLAAGMHHLECQFDFDAAREQLANRGIESMAPFTDFPFLRQAFTAAEVWPVDTDVLRSAMADGAITAEQAEQFARLGASGSHLEILERNDGYKGFNQTGISDIIQRTDPRNPANALDR